MAVNKKPRWTKEEDKIVTYTMMAHMVMGKTMNGAFEQLSVELGRSIESVRSRWKNDLKPQYAHRIGMLQVTINKNGMKARSYKKWTVNEKSELKNIVQKYLKRGRTVESALRYYGKKHNRTFKSVYGMWYNNLAVKGF